MAGCARINDDDILEYLLYRRWRGAKEKAGEIFQKLRRHGGVRDIRTVVKFLLYDHLENSVV